MNLFSLLPFILLSFILVLLTAEAIEIYLRRRKIPIRIHVNGTRGKSSVAEFIAAGLRASGRTPFAKITGIIPIDITSTQSSANNDPLLTIERTSALQREYSYLRRRAG